MPARNSSMELSSPTNAEATAEAEPGRRKSGRIVKAPANLSMYPNTSKRKRDSNGADESDEDSDEGIEDSAEDDSDDQHGPRKRKSKKVTNTNAVSKRSKQNGLTTTLPVRTATAAKPKKAKKGARLTDASDVGLYSQIFGAENNLDDITASWLARFNDHQANALTELVNLLLRCSGCVLQVNVYDIEDPDNAANRLTEIQEEYQAQNVSDYPLTAKSKNTATFKRTLTGFFDSLIKSISASSLLYKDPDLIENIQVWVACLSSAANRPFRHTATIVAFSIISALCELAKALITSRATLTRQVEGEQKKSRANKKRIADLQSQAEQTDQTRTQLDAIIKDWYDTIFVHRYRDVIPAIRVDSIIYLTDWMMTHPDEFFDGAHLRYLGWLLADEDKAVRHEVVKQLQRVYSDESKIAGLRQFTERFRPRIIEMATRDKETNVRASAVGLLEILRDAGLLEPDDIDTIGRLVYDVEPLVRKAVVPFVVASVNEILTSKLDELGGEEALDEGLPAPVEDDFESIRTEWLTFKTLAELLQSFDPESDSVDGSSRHSKDVAVAASTEIESRFSFATNAIFQQFADLDKWELLAGYLLFDHSQDLSANRSNDFESEFKQQCKLSEKEEAILLDVLNTSVKISLSEAVEQGKEKKARKSKREAQLLLEEQETSAQRLAAIIPKLLRKFGAVAEAACAVLRLERMLNLEVFQDLRQDSTTFASLLDDVKRQFMSHDDSSVLAQASAALNHANSSEGLGEITAERVQELWDESTNLLMSHCRGEELLVRGGIDDVVLAGISGAILRIMSLARVSNCVEPMEKARKYVAPKAQRKQYKDPPIAALDLITKLLSRGRPGSHISAEINEVEDNLVMNIMQCLLYYFLWQVHRLQQPHSASSGPGESDLAKLAKIRSAISSLLQKIITERHGADAVRVAAAELLLDIHTIFIDRAGDAGSPGMKELAAEQISARGQADILRVLAAVEKDFATKSNRKLEDVGDDDEPEDLSDDEDDAVSSSSDEDVDGPDQQALQRRRGRAAQKQKDVLVAEYRLCEFAGKMVRAVIAGVVDDANADGLAKPASASQSGPVRRRLVKNRARLGANFKGVIEALERTDGSKGGRSAADKTRAKGQKAAKAQNAKTAKSKATVESEDEESDGDEDVRMGDEIEDDDDDDALRRNGLVDDNGPDGEDVLQGEKHTESEVESVLGD